MMRYLWASRVLFSIVGMTLGLFFLPYVFNIHEYLAVANFVVAIGYYLIILAILVAPFAIPWLRRLGFWGALFASFLIEFFFGCGTHHLTMVGHFWTDAPMTMSADDLWPFALWDTMQIQGAFGALLVAQYKGKFFINQLKSPCKNVTTGEHCEHCAKG